MFGCCCESTHAKDHRTTTPVIRGNFTERLFSEAGNVAPRVYRSWCCAKNPKGAEEREIFTRMIHSTKSSDTIMYLLILGIA